MDGINGADFPDLSRRTTQLSKMATCPKLRPPHPSLRRSYHAGRQCALLMLETFPAAYARRDDANTAHPAPASGLLRSAGRFSISGGFKSMQARMPPSRKCSPRRVDHPPEFDPAPHLFAPGWRQLVRRIGEWRIHSTRPMTTTLGASCLIFDLGACL